MSSPPVSAMQVAVGCSSNSNSSSSSCSRNLNKNHLNNSNKNKNNNTKKSNKEKNMSHKTNNNNNNNNKDSKVKASNKRNEARGISNRGGGGGGRGRGGGISSGRGGGRGSGANTRVRHASVGSEGDKDKDNPSQQSEEAAAAAAAMKKRQGFRRSQSLDASHLLNFHHSNHNNNHNHHKHRGANQNKKKSTHVKSIAEQRARREHSSTFYLQSSPSHAFVLTRCSRWAGGLVGSNPVTTDTTLANHHQEAQRAIVQRALTTARWWDDVLLVQWRIDTPATNTTTTQGTQCPVCLAPYTAPRMTRCGHVFCFPCILRHLHSTTTTTTTTSQDSSARQGGNKCPCCFEHMDVEQLKPVHLVTVRPPRVGQSVSFVKLHRRKAMPLPTTPSGNAKQAPVTQPHNLHSEVPHTLMPFQYTTLMQQQQQQQQHKIHQESLFLPCANHEDAKFARFSFVDYSHNHDHHDSMSPTTCTPFVKCSNSAATPTSPSTSTSTSPPKTTNNTSSTTSSSNPSSSSSSASSSSSVSSSYLQHLHQDLSELQTALQHVATLTRHGTTYVDRQEVEFLVMAMEAVQVGIRSFSQHELEQKQHQQQHQQHYQQQHQQYQGAVMHQQLQGGSGSSFLHAHAKRHPSNTNNTNNKQQPQQTCPENHNQESGLQRFVQEECCTFYQLPDGQLCFLSGFNMHCLQYECTHGGMLEQEDIEEDKEDLEEEEEEEEAARKQAEDGRGKQEGLEEEGKQGGQEGENGGEGTKQSDLTHGKIGEVDQTKEVEREHTPPTMAPADDNTLSATNLDANLPVGPFSPKHSKQTHPSTTTTTTNEMTHLHTTSVKPTLPPPSSSTTPTPNSTTSTSTTNTNTTTTTQQPPLALLLPSTIQGQILSMETLHLNAETRKRHAFLSHLPLYTDVILLELALSNHVLSEATKMHFAPEMERRKKVRKNKAAMERRRRKEMEVRRRREEEEVRKRNQRLSVDWEDAFFHPLESGGGGGGGGEYGEADLLGAGFGPELGANANANANANSNANANANANADANANGNDQDRPQDAPRVQVPSRKVTVPPHSAYSFRTVCQTNGFWPELQNSSVMPKSHGVGATSTLGNSSPSRGSHTGGGVWGGKMKTNTPMRMGSKPSGSTAMKTTTSRPVPPSLSSFPVMTPLSPVTKPSPSVPSNWSTLGRSGVTSTPTSPPALQKPITQKSRNSGGGNKKVSLFSTGGQRGYG